MSAVAAGPISVPPMHLYLAFTLLLVQLTSCASRSDISFSEIAHRGMSISIDSRLPLGGMAVTRSIDRIQSALPEFLKDRRVTKIEIAQKSPTGRSHYVATRGASGDVNVHILLDPNLSSHTVYHELTHALMGLTLLDSAPFAVEGLVEYVSARARGSEIPHLAEAFTRVTNTSPLYFSVEVGLGSSTSKRALTLQEPYDSKEVDSALESGLQQVTDRHFNSSLPLYPIAYICTRSLMAARSVSLAEMTREDWNSIESEMLEVDRALFERFIGETQQELESESIPPFAQTAAAHIARTITKLAPARPASDGASLVITEKESRFNLRERPEIMRLVTDELALIE